MAYSCPVCEYGALTDDPATGSYEICPQCGVEFGLEPPELYPRIRQEWIEAGRPFWRDTIRPWPWLGEE